MIPRPLEVTLHKLLKELLKETGDQKGSLSRDQKPSVKFLLAISGGLDSMALFYAFCEMAKKFPFKIVVGHIHHGPSSDRVQRAFRDGAQAFVQKKCEEQHIEFFTNTIDEAVELKSEEEFRKLRLEALAQIKKQTGSDMVVFAHHSEDLLETRLLRLIRGTGPDGLVSMQIKKRPVLRPFLNHSKQDLLSYLELVGGEWIKDPSNDENIYLRNWLRNNWLPALELRVPGASARLGQSLQNLADLNAQSRSLKHCFEDEKLLRGEFLSLDLTDKRRVLSHYLRRHVGREFGLSHLNELIKRLDVEQNDLTFRVLKKNWRANARHIWCES